MPAADDLQKKKRTRGSASDNGSGGRDAGKEKTERNGIRRKQMKILEYREDMDLRLTVETSTNTAVRESVAEIIREVRTRGGRRRTSGPITACKS